MSVVATAPLPHKLVDIKSAVRYGPSNGGVKMPCAGLLEPDGGREHGYVSTVCTSCGYALAIPAAALEGLIAASDIEPREPWWQK